MIRRNKTRSYLKLKKGAVITGEFKKVKSHDGYYDCYMLGKIVKITRNERLLNIFHKKQGSKNIQCAVCTVENFSSIEVVKEINNEGLYNL